MLHVRESLVRPAQRSVFHALVDRLLRLDRADRVRRIARMRAGLRKFPATAAFDRAALLRAVVLNDATNRIVFRLGGRFPAAAKVLARAVPIVGETRLFRELPLDRPIILGLMHFGEIQFALTVALRLLRGRPIHIFHAGGDGGEAASAYISSMGCTPHVTGGGATRVVEEAVARDPRCAVILCFDHLCGDRRLDVPFLGDSLSATTGIAYLADRLGATVVSGWWDPAGSMPRLRIGGKHEIDASLSPQDRLREFTERMFGLLEACVKAAPQQWTEWSFCVDKD
jgi:lauroyl/myristoyl acyltransferase